MGETLKPKEGISSKLGGADETKELAGRILLDLVREYPLLCSLGECALRTEMVKSLNE